MRDRTCVTRTPYGPTHECSGKRTMMETTTSTTATENPSTTPHVTVSSAAVRGPATEDRRVRVAVIDVPLPDVAGVRRGVSVSVLVSGDRLFG